MEVFFHESILSLPPLLLCKRWKKTLLLLDYSWAMKEWCCERKLMSDDRIKKKKLTLNCFTRMCLLEYSHIGKDIESFDVLPLKKNSVCMWYFFLISQKQVLQISWNCLYRQNSNRTVQQKRRDSWEKLVISRRFLWSPWTTVFLDGYFPELSTYKM